MDLTPITVVVEGKNFYTTKNTLLLSGYFRGHFDAESNITTIIVTDRSKKLFKNVLAYLRDQLHPFPLKYKYELDYYDIDYDEKKLYDHNKEIIKEMNANKNYLLKKYKKNKELLRQINNQIEIITGNTTPKQTDQCELCDNDRFEKYRYCKDHLIVIENLLG